MMMMIMMMVMMMMMVMVMKMMIVMMMMMMAMTMTMQCNMCKGRLKTWRQCAIDGPEGPSAGAEPQQVQH